ncbi:hypothetical protein [Aquimarina agarivorans]|uniref:hypothetical protein n=1 Tax=Aquimarina agarivorans TaxID=980584 RepID=UPI000248F628|nr:hypothetical protein [Aquimarina agarivorans]
MKYFLYILIALAVAMMGFNVTQIDFSAPFSENSKVAFIAIISGLCVIALALILLISKAIERKHKELNN